MKLLTDMLTERDNRTWCLFRVCGFGCICILVGITMFSVLHYSIHAEQVDPVKISTVMDSFADTFMKVLGTAAGAVGAKSLSKADADSAPGNNQ